MRKQARDTIIRTISSGHYHNLSAVIWETSVFWDDFYIFAVACSGASIALKIDHTFQLYVRIMELHPLQRQFMQEVEAFKSINSFGAVSDSDIRQFELTTKLAYPSSSFKIRKSHLTGETEIWPSRLLSDEELTSAWRAFDKKHKVTKNNPEVVMSIATMQPVLGYLNGPMNVIMIQSNRFKVRKFLQTVFNKSAVFCGGLRHDLLHYEFDPAVQMLASASLHLHGKVSIDMQNAELIEPKLQKTTCCVEIRLPLSSIHSISDTSDVPQPLIIDRALMMYYHISVQIGAQDYSRDPSKHAICAITSLLYNGKDNDSNDKPTLLVWHCEPDKKTFVGNVDTRYMKAHFKNRISTDVSYVSVSEKIFSCERVLILEWLDLLSKQCDVDCLVSMDGMREKLPWLYARLRSLQVDNIPNINRIARSVAVVRSFAKQSVQTGDASYSFIQTDRGQIDIGILSKQFKLPDPSVRFILETLVPYEARRSCSESAWKHICLEPYLQDRLDLGASIEMAIELVLLLLKSEKFSNIVLNLISLSNISNTCIRDLQQTGEYKKVMNLLYKQTYTSNFLFNFTVDLKREGWPRSSGKMQGGNVYDPWPGEYDYFVLILDFQSLYPNIMVSDNFDFTSAVRTSEEAKRVVDDGVCIHAQPAYRGLSGPVILYFAQESKKKPFIRAVLQHLLSEVRAIIYFFLFVVVLFFSSIVPC